MQTVLQLLKHLTPGDVATLLADTRPALSSLAESGLSDKVIFNFLLPHDKDYLYIEKTLNGA